MSRSSFATMMQLWRYEDAPAHLRELVEGGSWVLVVPLGVEVPGWFRATSKQTVRAFAVGESDTCYVAIPSATVSAGTPTTETEQ